MGLFKSKKQTIVGYPLIGGAVTLMPEDMSAAMYRGGIGGVTFITPDTGRPALSQQDFRVAVIETALFEGSPSFLDPEYAAVMDAALHTYHDLGVDWDRILRYAKTKNSVKRKHGWWTKAKPHQPMSINCFLSRDKLPRGYLFKYQDAYGNWVE